MSYKSGDKVWVLPGPVTYPGGLESTVDDTHAGVVTEPDPKFGAGWYVVDIPGCPLPQGAACWVVHEKFLKPRRDDPPEMGSWNDSVWEYLGWNPMKVPA